MAYFDSFDALVSSVQEAYEDNSQEFVDYISRSIRLAELRITRELDGNLLKQNTEVTCSAGDRLIFKPSGYRFSYNAFLYNTSSGSEKIMRHATDDFIRDYWPIPTSVGEPKYFSTDYSDSQMILAPTPASSKYRVRLNLQLDATPISAGNQTNFFTNKCGELLYYATMVEQSKFAKDPDKAQLWENTYMNALQGFNNEARRNRAADGQTPASPTQNTLMGDA